MRFKI